MFNPLLQDLITYLGSRVLTHNSPQHLKLPVRTLYTLGCQLTSIVRLEHAILRPQYHSYVAGQTCRYGISVYAPHTCLRTSRLTTSVQKPVKNTK